MITKTKKQKYHEPYEGYKKCLCGRPYFYLESLKKCPGCGKKLIFYGDLVNEVILEYYFNYPYLTCGKTLIEKIVFLGQCNRSKDVFKDDSIDVEKLFFEEDEVKYLNDILVFLKLFLKELDERYRVIQEKEINNKLSEKDPFENLIIKLIKYNQSENASSKFFNLFPVKSISKEEILKRLQNYLLYPREQKIIEYFLDHTIEETGEKFGVTRERIHQIIAKVWELFKDTVEYKQYEKLEIAVERAREEYEKAVDRYYKSIEEKAKWINQAIKDSA